MSKGWTLKSSLTLFLCRENLWSTTTNSVKSKSTTTRRPYNSKKRKSMQLSSKGNLGQIRISSLNCRLYMTIKILMLIKMRWRLTNGNGYRKYTKTKIFSKAESHQMTLCKALSVTATSWQCCHRSQKRIAQLRRVSLPRLSTKPVST